jgi:methionyl-tRNA formyltransferase
MAQPAYVLLTDRPLMQEMLGALEAHDPGCWHLITDPADLNFDTLQALAPAYVFAPHWSRKIPADVFENFTVVVFHMTDLPYGRGGSPLQNLIARGHKETVISALQCIEDFDAGPIYLKVPLSLHGAADEIFLRARDAITGMIQHIVRQRPTPEPQAGEPVYFKRRRPADGSIANLETLEQVYDYIRMLDGEGYPPAFLETGGFRFEFSRAVHRNGRIEADVRITATKEKS